MGVAQPKCARFQGSTSLLPRSGMEAGEPWVLNILHPLLFSWKCSQRTPSLSFFSMGYSRETHQEVRLCDPHRLRPLLA